MSTSKKHRDFVAEPMDTKTAQQVPGVGPTYAARLARNNIHMATDLRRIYRQSADKTAFQNRMSRDADMKIFHSSMIYEAMKEHDDLYEDNEQASVLPRARQPLGTAASHAFQSINNVDLESSEDSSADELSEEIGVHDYRSLEESLKEVIQNEFRSLRESINHTINERFQAMMKTIQYSADAPGISSVASVGQSGKCPGPTRQRGPQ